jgi:hypothetical protein
MAVRASASASGVKVIETKSFSQFREIRIASITCRSTASKPKLGGDRSLSQSTVVVA